MYTWNYSKGKIVFQPKKYFYICYKLVQGFSVTGLFTGQYSAKGYDTNTDDIGAHHIETRQIQYTRWTNKKS